MAKMNITKKSSKQMLNNAGSDIAKANNNVLIPFAPFTKRSTLPTFATLTTRRSVGDTKYFSIISLNTSPENYLQLLPRMVVILQGIYLE